MRSLAAAAAACPPGCASASPRARAWKGWTAVTRHKTPWLLVGEQAPAFDDDVWELYDTSVDWTQFEDLAAQHPDRLHELQRLFVIEAASNNVLPLDDASPSGSTRTSPAGRR